MLRPPDLQIGLTPFASHCVPVVYHLSSLQHCGSFQKDGCPTVPLLLRKQSEKIDATHAHTPRNKGETGQIKRQHTVDPQFTPLVAISYLFMVWSKPRLFPSRLHSHSSRGAKELCWVLSHGARENLHVVPLWWEERILSRGAKELMFHKI